MTAAQVWKALYASGKNDLIYPSETFVRVFARLVPGDAGPQRVLDYGFGTGANLIHMARRGHRVHGIEVSPHARDIAQQRLSENNLTAELVVTDDRRIPFPDDHFDVVVSWLVVYYNDEAGMRAIVRELERVTRPGGRLIVSIIAPNDVSHRHSRLESGKTYVSELPEQAGCELVVLEKFDIPSVFEGDDLQIGESSFDYLGSLSRHWIITYRTPAGRNLNPKRSGYVS